MQRRSATRLLRRGAVLAVGALFVACSHGDPTVTPQPAEADSTSSTTVPAGSSTTAVRSGGTATTALDPIVEPPATQQPAGSSTTVASSIDADVPPGRLAAFILRAGESRRIVLELRAQSGAVPRQATIDHLVSILRSASGKRVSVDGPRALSGGARAWRASELRATADRGAQFGQNRETAVLRLLFVEGTYEGDERYLGVAVRGDVAAIFSDQVQASGGLFGIGALEVAVSTHEVGHLLGLVDLYLDTGRDDPEHPNHSRNHNSVMYWAVESSLVSQVLTNGPPTEFDADDRADLARIRRS